MLSKSRTMLRRLGHWACVATCGAMLPQAAQAQPAWGAEQFFRYNIENVVVKPAGSGTWNVKVIFSGSSRNRVGDFEGF